MTPSRLGNESARGRSDRDAAGVAAGDRPAGPRPGAALQLTGEERFIGLSVESGSLVRGTHDGPDTSRITLATGFGFRIGVESSGSWRAGEDAPATVLVLTISPPDGVDVVPDGVSIEEQ
jgi:hypothetical protein